MKITLSICFLALISVMYGQEYPIGVYGCYPNGRYFQEMKDAGVSVVHTYAIGGSQSGEATAQFLENAGKHQLKVMFYLRAPWWNTDGRTVDGAMQYFREYKDHPALAMCLLADEPKENILEYIKTFNTEVKKIKPDLPTAVVENRVKGWWKYAVDTTTSDILMFDFYPVGDKPFPEMNLALYTQFLDAAAKYKKPFMPVIQINNLNVFPNIVKQRGYQADQCRYPNETELKFMIWTAVSQGAKGIFFYSLERAFQRDPKRVWLDGTFLPQVRELREFSELAAPLPEITAVKNGADNKFYAAYWKRAGGEYAVIANNSGAKQVCRIQLPLNDFKPWGSTRADAVVNNGVIELEPWESVILTK